MLYACDKTWCDLRLLHGIHFKQRARGVELRVKFVADSCCVNEETFAAKTGRASDYGHDGEHESSMQAMHACIGEVEREMSLELSAGCNGMDSTQTSRGDGLLNHRLRQTDPQH